MASLAVLLVLGAGAGLLTAVGGDEEPEDDATGEPRSTDEFDVAVTPLEGRPSSITAAGGRIWVTDDDRNVVVPLDPADGTFAGEAVEVADDPVAIAAGGDDELWVAHAGGELTRIDVTADGATADEPIDVGGTPIAIAVDGDGVWVGDISGRAIRRIDRGTGDLGDPIVVPNGVVRITPDDAGGLWVTGFEHHVTRVDAATGDVEPPVRVGEAPIGAAIVGGQLWVANSEADSVSRIALESGERVGPDIDVGDAPVAIAVDGQDVWVLNQDGASMTPLTLDGKRAGDEVGLGSRPRGVVVTAAGAWAAGVDPSAAVLVSRRSS